MFIRGRRAGAEASSLAQAAVAVACAVEAAAVSRQLVPGKRTRASSGVLAPAFPGAMNPNCARCCKIVYPTEKVNCLDKVRLGIGRRVFAIPELQIGGGERGWVSAAPVTAIAGGGKVGGVMGCEGRTPVWKPGDPGRGKESTRGGQPLLERSGLGAPGWRSRAPEWGWGE